MEGRKFGSAPNFTGACIVMFGVNLAWVLLFLFAVYGLVAAVFIALILNHWLNWLEHRRRSEAQTTTSLCANKQSNRSR